MFKEENVAGIGVVIRDKKGQVIAREDPTPN